MLIVYVQEAAIVQTPSKMTSPDQHQWTSLTPTDNQFKAWLLVTTITVFIRWFPWIPMFITNILSSSNSNITSSISNNQPIRAASPPTHRPMTPPFLADIIDKTTMLDLVVQATPRWFTTISTTKYLVIPSLVHLLLPKINFTQKKMDR